MLKNVYKLIYKVKYYFMMQDKLSEKSFQINWAAKSTTLIYLFKEERQVINK